jgi:choline monooxygenase
MKLPSFEKDLTLASTLPATLYVDPAVLALEQDRIFARTWQPVGNLADLASQGAFITGEVAGEPILVTRTAAGDLRAFYNVCRHRAGPLAQGKGNRKLLTCGYHGWTYSLEGKLLKTPDFEGAKSFDPSCNGLVPIRVETFGPWVFVNLDRDAEPLLTMLGEIVAETEPFEMSTFRPIAKRDYDIACNWKVYVDNYLEGYHLPVVHPGLFRELDYDQYRVDTFKLHSSQYAPFRPPRPGQKRQYEDSDERALYYWVFPNWMINVYPDNMSINVIKPINAFRTITFFEWFAKGEPKIPIEKTMEFSHEIQVEDVTICEAVQKRLGSRGYPGGRFNPRRENGVHHFQGLVHAYLSKA